MTKPILLRAIHLGDHGDWARVKIGREMCIIPRAAIVDLEAEITEGMREAGQRALNATEDTDSVFRAMLKAWMEEGR